jgi:putative membrane protein
MHDGRWTDGMGSGNGWWMAIMMIAVVALAAVIIVAVLRNGTHQHSHALAPSPPPSAGRSTPQEILAQRLARGEIEPDDYSKRLAALHAVTPPN